MKPALLILLSGGLLITACKPKPKENKEAAQTQASADSASYTQGPVNLPPPFSTPSAKLYSDVIGWQDSTRPKAPQGFTVTLFADKLDNPRWVYQAPDGNIFVAESNTTKSATEKVKDAVTGKAKSMNTGSANRITVFRDADGDGKPEFRKVFLTSLNQPFGMLVLKDHFYVANTDGLLRFPYKAGADKTSGAAEKILDLPKGGYNNHWTRNIITNADSSKIYISVGSGSNNAEHGMENEIRRANILVINPDGSNEEIYATGLRNPVGMDWAPGTQTLWTAVNERDELGDELVPDYITSVQKGGFYGWPYSYFGKNEDPRMKGQRTDLVEKAIAPDIALGNHTASLGLAFYKGQAFPEQYRNGAFVAQHGSWNRSRLSGYKVVFIPFKNGKPSGEPEDFLTGFVIDPQGNKVHGRPVGVTVLKDGSMLVTDDAANCIWRISASHQ
ncbi:PQQ-dependent sugar dehydrogenase [Pseudobacter ginsenosidimutans]|uniref:Glucose/arabinose dehydrogenase n=1 Tax=Pseudobacter ginsenosidimutans TaxID=661488 RepID=A0A4Q7N2I1_9BACT|nr:sorbosone dehydrogenase family protein [Pseudobacter ginsenosidimutans]QEC43659.1 sorbosone dehydrogenase family protein [Pseudobacter ginsenosidimutans]RZS75059.1 glucose/arabinose dehydrogenase [Pseudobacter ginsenosidimutans]